MPHVITELCTRKGDCVEVCPVECIVPGPRGNADWPLFYIDPDQCIDCGACVSACPPAAIFPDTDLPADQQHMKDVNAEFFKSGPGYWDFDLEAERDRD